MADRLFPNWLRGYLQHTRHSEAPDPFHLWTGISTIAGVLRRRVWMEEFHFQWTPNFYIILVGPPGIVAKSTTSGIGLSLLREVPGIKFGPQSVSWQALVDAMEEAGELVYMEDANNSEALLEQKAYPMAPITCSISELGTFLKPANTEMIDVLVDLWDGKLGAWEKRLRQNKNKIENPWINIIGCTTPKWIEQNCPPYMIGGGLFSRTVFVWGAKKRQMTPYLSRVINHEEYEVERAALIEDLKHIATLKGQFKLTEAAYDWGEEWYTDHWNNRPIHMLSERFDGYRARKQTLIHKTAMVLTASESDELVITKDRIEQAARLVSALEVDMLKVFELVGLPDETRNIWQLLHYVKQIGRIKSGDLWRYCMQNMPLKNFDEAINAAIRAGYIQQLTEAGVTYYYALDPKPIDPEQYQPAPDPLQPPVPETADLYHEQAGSGSSDSASSVLQARAASSGPDGS